MPQTYLTWSWQGNLELPSKLQVCVISAQGLEATVSSTRLGFYKLPVGQTLSFEETARFKSLEVRYTVVCRNP